MRRQLTAREWMLLALLGVILLIGGYILLFYNPMIEERDRCLSEAESCRMQTEAARVRLEDKRRMEKELDALFSSETPPLSIPDYDNLQPVMFALNSILANTQNYSLSFSTVDSSQTIIRRSISMTFTTGTYKAAREVLQQLHDSDYRCLLDNVTLNLGRLRGGFFEIEYDSSISVSGTIVFFEYQNQSESASPSGAA